MESGINWGYFRKLCRYHNNQAAAFRFFTDLDLIEVLDDNFRQEIENEYLLAQARFIKKESELVEVVGALERNGIVPIVFKGIPLAHMLYEDPGVRVSKDIDILVAPGEFETAKSVLIDIGFSVYSDVFSEAEYRDYHFHLIFTRGKKMDVVVELHWTLVDVKKGHGMDMEALRDRSVPVTVAGKEIRTLCIEHFIWYTAIHLSYVAFLDVRNMAELKRMVVILDEGEWGGVIDWARRCNSTAELKLSLRISEILFGGFMPRRTRKKLLPDFFTDRFIAGIYYPRGLVWEWAPFCDTLGLVTSLSLRRGLRKKIDYMYRLVFPDRYAWHEVYAFRKKGERRRGGEFIIEGLVVLVKVLIMTFMLGFSVRTGVLGEKRMDPLRSKRIK